MRSRCHRRTNRLAGNNRPNRKAASKPLGKRNNIRLDSGIFIGKQPSSPTNACLHLISNYQRAKFISRFTHTGKIAIGHLLGTAFALYRFDHHRRYMRPKRGTKRVQIAKRNMVKSSWHRAKTSAENWSVSRRKHA